MSATNDAGRLLLIPRGTYNNTTSYEVLDVVYYDSGTTQALYVCKQNSTGNLPTNTTYWQVLIDLTGFIQMGDVDEFVEKFVKDTVGWTRKNLITFPYHDSSKTENGITWTVMSDGGIHVTGTRTGTAEFFFDLQTAGLFIPELVGQEVIMSGGVADAVRMNLWLDTEGNYSEMGEEIHIQLPDTLPIHWNCKAIIPSDVTGSLDVTFYPMIRRASIEDNTFVRGNITVEEAIKNVITIASINPNATAEFAADWLLNSSGRVIIPSTQRQYRVSYRNKEMLFYWAGTSYAPLGSSGHTIINSSALPMAGMSNLQFGSEYDPIFTENDVTNDKTIVHGQLFICDSESDWNTLSDADFKAKYGADREQVGVYWYLPWANSIAYQTDLTPVGAVLSCAVDTTNTTIFPADLVEFPNKDYLICRGATVKITDYPALYQYFEDEYGDGNYFGTAQTAEGYFVLPNWSADFPTNGVLVIKARVTSDVITFAEVDDEAVTAENVWSAEKIYETIQILIRDTQYISGLRYKNLGSQPTTEQLTRLANGDFTDFWNGDHWTYGGKNYRIVDNTNYYLNKGDTAFNKPGLIIMRDDNTLKGDGSTTKYMKDTNDTTGGLKATKWWTTYRSQVKSTYDAWCGSSHIGQFRDLITNAVTNGHASGWEWADCTVQLPGEVQIYGSQIWGVGQDMNVNNGGLSGYNTGIAYPQLALFRLAPRWITNRENYWLKDICSPSHFADVSSDGCANHYSASYAWGGLRPLFILV